MPNGRWKTVTEGTGQYVHVNPSLAQFNRIPDYDERTGAHLWNVLLMFQVDPTIVGDVSRLQMLNSENLLTTSPPGCYYCEEQYTPLLATRRCKGEPRG